MYVALAEKKPRNISPAAAKARGVQLGTPEQAKVSTKRNSAAAVPVQALPHACRDDCR
jgi:hypothetical protein